MQTLSRPLPPPPAAGDDHGVGSWAVAGDCDAAAIVRVPGEQVLVLVADLPLASRQKRLAAAPFAIEDLIADPIAAVHVAVGAEVAQRRYLVAVVRHDVMRAWVAQAATSGQGRAPIVPDALMLPRPAAGEWSVASDGARALVRSDDGAGFALSVAHLAIAWIAAGRPACACSGEPLPAGFDRAPVAELGDAPAVAPIDLRQGLYALHRAPLSRVWRRIAIVAAAGIAAHAAIAVADIAALRHIAAAREMAARALLERLAPGVPVGDDVAAAVVDLLPAAQGAERSRFLPMLVRTATALAPLRGTAGLRTIAFDAAAATLTIEVDAADIAGLQRVAAALTGAGLTAESGAASVDEGRATGSFTIRTG